MKRTAFALVLFLFACSGRTPELPIVEPDAVSVTDAAVDHGSHVELPDGGADVGNDAGADETEPESGPQPDVWTETCGFPTPTLGNRPFACATPGVYANDYVPQMFAWETMGHTPASCGWASTPTACYCDYSCACLRAQNVCASLGAGWSMVACNDSSTTAVEVDCR